MRFDRQSFYVENSRTDRLDTKGFTDGAKPHLHFTASLSEWFKFGYYLSLAPPPILTTTSDSGHRVDLVNAIKGHMSST